MKRLFDVVAASAALVCLSPVMALLACATRMKLGAPVLFQQTRIGRHEKPFTLFKFRTMSTGDAGDEQRTSNFGAFVRSSSLDELPELVNVIKGDMSLVGPRPLLPEYLPLYSEEQARRHEVRPGLTGLAQVSGRNMLSWSEKFQLDVAYVDQHSLRLDFSILLSTIKAVVQRRDISADGGAPMPVFDGTN